MSPAHNYKKLENKIVGTLVKGIKIFFLTVFGFVKLLMRKGKQRFTVMFIPHSEKKIFNFHISVFLLLFISFLVCAVSISFALLAINFTTTNKGYLQVKENLEIKESGLEVLKEELRNLDKTSIEFNQQMKELLAVLGGESKADQLLYNTARGGEVADYSPSSSEDSEKSEIQSEIFKIRIISNKLVNSIGPLKEITNLLYSQKELLVDIPTLWPLEKSNGQRIGNITAWFGVEENPFTKGFRLHNGIDIAWSEGTPIIAAANGKVVEVAFNPSGLGNVVRIRHKYGFSTRYGHLSYFIVKKGQVVVRGQIIGYMGTTGMSTGPHVHYEIWMGTQVVDPISFLDIQSPLVGD